MSDDEPIRMVRLSLGLRPDTYDHDVALISNLRHAANWFNTVWAGVFSWQEQPWAASHTLVQYLKKTTEDLGLIFVWARRLWPSWSNEAGERWNREGIIYDAAYYARALQTVQREGTALRAPHIGLDAEMYGKAPDIALKTADLTERQIWRIENAIAAAKEATGAPLWVVKPYDSSRESSVNWSMGDLASFGVSGKTRYATSLDTLPSIGTPPGRKWAPGFWESDVSLAGERYLRPAQVRDLPWPLIHQQTGAIGVSVHLNRDGPQVLADWSK